VPVGTGRYAVVQRAGDVLEDALDPGVEAVEVEGDAIPLALVARCHCPFAQ
jgi:hypothetical protein